MKKNKKKGSKTLYGIDMVLLKASFENLMKENQNIFLNIPTDHVPFQPQKTFLEATTPSVISIANAPPELGGITQNVSMEEFKSIFEFPLKEGMEGLDVADIYITESIISDISRDHLMAQIETVLRAPDPRLIITKINEQVGYGVFASDMIKKNTVLCIYSGEITPYIKTDDYSFQFYKNDYCINPSKYRGIGSFFQHLPTRLKINVEEMHSVLHQTRQFISKEEIMQQEELYSIQFESEACYQQLATANLNPEYVMYKNFPIIVFVANRDIMPGEQLGFDYGYNYWLARNRHPEYFDKRGQVIASTEYRRIFGTINVNNVIYTGHYQPLIDVLSEDSLFCNIHNTPIAKLDLERALLLAGALHPSEIKYSHFKATDSIELDDLVNQRDRFLELLENTALEFNRSHCNKQTPGKGYWSYEAYLEIGSENTDYETGMLNSPFFIKIGPFIFEKVKGASAYEACSSLLSDAAFGIIKNTNWIYICQILTAQKILNQEVFDYVFSDLTISANVSQCVPKLINSFSRLGKNVGSIVRYKSDPDYKFRHPFGPFKSITTMKLSKAVGQGFEKPLSDEAIIPFLKESYYKPQSEKELDYIHKVSDGRLLEYLVPEHAYTTSKKQVDVLNIPFFALLHLTNNHYDQCNWIKTFKSSSKRLIKLNVSRDDYVYLGEFTIDAFTETAFWRIVFTNNAFNEEKSIKLPKDNDRYYSMLQRPSASLHDKYSYVRRKKIQHSEQLLTICTNILMYYLNADSFQISSEFIKGFQLIQELRFQLLELKSKNLLEDFEFQPCQKKPEIKKPEILEDVGRFKALVAVDPEVKQIIAKQKKEACEKERERLCYQLAIPKTATEEDIKVKRRQLLFFWHPDINKSIIAEDMTKQIVNETDEAIKLTKELELLEFESSSENRLLM